VPWTGVKLRERFGVAFGKVTLAVRFAVRQTRAQGRAVRILPPAALILFGASCGGFFISENSLVTLTISPTAILLKAGASPADSSTLTPAGVTAGNAAATNFSAATWSSSNNAVVTVTGGVVTAAANAAANATATITAKDSGVTSNTCTVVLYTGTAPTTLTVNSQSGATTFAAGTSFQASATAAFPGDTTLSSSGALTPYVSWSTSDSTVATVSSAGVVSVLSSSPFTVTAIATFGAANSNATLTGTSLEFNNTII
jgi:hypothetical protein